jgi:uncharacterized small protein (DUF1192 family)
MTREPAIINLLRDACQKGREDLEPWQCDPFLFDEAADEIKRLTAENADLRRWKALDKPLTAAMAIVVTDMQQLRAEVERLRQLPPYPITTLSQEVEKLRAEIERLRAALADTSHARTCSTLMQGMAYGPCDCGRAALEPKP